MDSGDEHSSLISSLSHENVSVSSENTLPDRHPQVQLEISSKNGPGVVRLPAKNIFSSSVLASSYPLGKNVLEDFGFRKKTPRTTSLSDSSSTSKSHPNYASIELASTAMIAVPSNMTAEIEESLLLNPGDRYVGKAKYLQPLCRQASAGQVNDHRLPPKYNSFLAKALGKSQIGSTFPIHYTDKPPQYVPLDDEQVAMRPENRNMITDKVAWPPQLAENPDDLYGHDYYGQLNHQSTKPPSQIVTGWVLDGQKSIFAQTTALPPPPPREKLNSLMRRCLSAHALTRASRNDPPKPPKPNETPIAKEFECPKFTSWVKVPTGSNTPRIISDKRQQPPPKSLKYYHLTDSLPTFFNTTIDPPATAVPSGLPRATCKSSARRLRVSPKQSTPSHVPASVQEPCAAPVPSGGDLKVVTPSKDWILQHAPSYISVAANLYPMPLRRHTNSVRNFNESSTKRPSTAPLRRSSKASTPVRSAMDQQDNRSSNKLIGPPLLRRKITAFDPADWDKSAKARASDDSRHSVSRRSIEDGSKGGFRARIESIEKRLSRVPKGPTQKGSLLFERFRKELEDRQRSRREYAEKVAREDPRNAAELEKINEQIAMATHPGKALRKKLSSPNSPHILESKSEIVRKILTSPLRSPDILHEAKPKPKAKPKKSVPKKKGRSKSRSTTSVARRSGVVECVYGVRGYPQGARTYTTAFTGANVAYNRRI